MKIINRILIVGVLALFALNLRSCYRRTQIEKELDLKKLTDQKIKQKIQKGATIISRKVDDLGAEHVVLDAAENLLPKSIFKDNPEALKGTFVDSNAVRLGIKQKQITEILVINSTLKADKLKALKQLDSMKRVFYTYSDPYVDLKFTPGDTATKTPDLFGFLYKPKFTIARYDKQKIPLVGITKKYIDISWQDPRMLINGVQKFTIEEQAPPFGIKVQLRTIYNFGTQKLYMGPGLSFDYKRFNFLAYLYYNYSTNAWEKVGGVNYDLIRF